MKTILILKMSFNKFDLQKEKVIDELKLKFYIDGFRKFKNFLKYQEMINNKMNNRIQFYQFHQF